MLACFQLRVGFNQVQHPPCDVLNIHFGHGFGRDDIVLQEQVQGHFGPAVLLSIQAIIRFQHRDDSHVDSINIAGGLVKRIPHNIAVRSF